MRTVKGFCEICGTDIEVQICCNSFDCGCMGLPVDPPVCSNRCYDELMNKIHNNNNNNENENKDFKKIT